MFIINFVTVRSIGDNIKKEEKRKQVIIMMIIIII